ncbi:MAG: rhomboid family intramembrane serine protease, partial [Syntrophothermus sp.]
MTDEKRKVIESVVPPAIFTAVIWLVWLAQLIFNTDFYWLGVYPRHLKGLYGILTSPFIHSGFDHLMSNTMPVFLLSAGILYFYSQSAWKVILYIYLFTGCAVWLLAGEVYHIGASGLIYGFAAFLYASGIIRRDTRAIALALIVTFLYGGLVWGLFALSP